MHYLVTKLVAFGDNGVGDFFRANHCMGKIILTFVALVFCVSSALALDLRQIVVGNQSASYYDPYGAVSGRTVRRNNVIEIYNRAGSFDGRITLENPMRVTDRNGAVAGRVAVNGSRLLIYNRSGAFVGSALLGSTTRFYDANGSADGWATSAGGTTIFYNSNGAIIGKKR